MGWEGLTADAMFEQGLECEAWFERIAFQREGPEILKAEVKWKTIKSFWICEWYYLTLVQ